MPLKLWKCFPNFHCTRQVDAVDKRHANLFVVPEDVLRYHRTLEELLLDSNQIKDLPKQFFKLVKLRKLGLSDNEIQQIPQEISHFVNLVDFDISRNDLAEIPEDIRFCIALEVVDASGNPLTKIPQGICELPNLRHLNLNDVSLIRLPFEIGDLKNLTTFECRENLLATIPDSISQLKKLEQLDLGNNELEILPDSITELTMLKELWLDGNHLNDIPKNLGNLSKLTCLDLTENKIESIPESIGGLVCVTDFTISHNFIDTLPTSIGEMKKLSIFKVDQNRLMKIPSDISNCTNLTELMLTENLLTELPESIGDLQKLTTLNADRNKLNYLTPAIGKCVSLNIISLRENQLMFLPEELGNLSKLHVLDISGNKLEHLPITLAQLSLKAIWLSENQSQSLLKFQTETLPDSGKQVLTCFLLPQQPSQSMTNLLNGSVATENDLTGLDKEKQKRITFHEDQLGDSDDEGKGVLQRHLTPHPKEMKKHQQSEVLKRHRQHKEEEKLREAGKDEAELETTTSDHEEDAKAPLLSNQQAPPLVKFETRPTTSSSSSSSESEEEKDSLNEYEEKGVSFTNETENNEDKEPMSDRLHRVDTPHYKRDMKISNTTKPENVIELLRKHSMKTAEESGLTSHEEICLTLNRKGGGLGLSIAGGKGSTPYVGEDDSVFISRVTEGGAADRAGLKVGDKLLIIGEKNILAVEHNEAVEVLKACGEIVDMKIERIVELEKPLVKEEEEVEVMTKQQTVTFAPEPEMKIEGESISINIIKSGSGLGFSIAGGIGSSPYKDGDLGIFISKVVEDGPADLAGLQIGDKVLTICGVDTTSIRHDETVKLLTETVMGSVVTIVVYREHMYYTQPPAELQAPTPKPRLSKGDRDSSIPVEELHISRGVGGHIGFSIVGGSDHKCHPFSINDPGVFVSKIQTGSEASHSGLQLGDRVLEVNGVDVRSATHEEAVNSLITSGNDITMLVSHDPPPKDMQVIEFDRLQGEKLGMSIRGGSDTRTGNPGDDSDEGIFVSKVSLDGAVYRDGRLKVGNRLLEVNNESLLSCKHADAVKVLRNIGEHISFVACYGFDEEMLGNEQQEPVFEEAVTEKPIPLTSTSSVDARLTDQELKIRQQEAEMLREQEEWEKEEELKRMQREKKLQEEEKHVAVNGHEEVEKSVDEDDVTSEDKPFTNREAIKHEPLITKFNYNDYAAIPHENTIGKLLPHDAPYVNTNNNSSSPDSEKSPFIPREIHHVEPPKSRQEKKTTPPPVSRKYVEKIPQKPEVDQPPALPKKDVPPVAPKPTQTTNDAVQMRHGGKRTPAQSGDIPERMSFRDRRKYFEREITSQSRREPQKEDSIRKKKISLISDQDLSTIKQEEERKYGTLTRDEIRRSFALDIDEDEVMTPEMLNDQYEPENPPPLPPKTPPAVPRKAPLSARESLFARQATKSLGDDDAIWHLEDDVHRATMIIDGQTPKSETNEHRVLSPSERRAMEAERRNKWKQERFQSLEADALQAQMVITKEKMLQRRSESST